MTATSPSSRFALVSPFEPVRAGVPIDPAQHIQDTFISGKEGGGYFETIVYTENSYSTVNEYNICKGGIIYTRGIGQDMVHRELRQVWHVYGASAYPYGPPIEGEWLPGWVERPL